MTDARYPVGKFEPKSSYAPEEIKTLIDDIEKLPSLLSEAVGSLTSEQLDTPYREGGWTVRQVIHHLADSHMNAYIRIKWALTEDNPIIKAYNEKAWATTAETQMDPTPSLLFLKSLHIKWTHLMKQLTEQELKRTFVHPETNKTQSLERVVATYAWHGIHHLAHITELKKKMGWN